MSTTEIEVERRVRELRNRPELLSRYDVTGDGELDDQEWELIRRMIAVELKTAEERGTSYELEVEPTVLTERYEVVGLLGRGGQAFTYLARDLDDGGDHVVIKELSIRVATDWKSIELFEREAEVLESLDHPRIPTYVDALHLEDADGTVRFMLVQDFVDGEDLGHLIDRGEKWDEEEAVRRTREICEILSYLHDRTPAVIHRDIKPSNLLLGRHGRLHLVDFGAVQTIVPATVGGSTIIGTTGYVPMEQYMGRARPASDLYALGATVVHMLTGEHPADLPFEHGRLDYSRHVQQTPELQAWLERLLEPVVEQRIQSAMEVLALLHDLYGELPPREPLPPDPEPEPEPEREPEPTPRSRVEKREFTVRSSPSAPVHRIEDGQKRDYLGKTPVTFELPTGDFPVTARLSRSGYKPLDLRLDEATPRTLSCELEKLPADADRSALLVSPPSELASLPPDLPGHFRVSGDDSRRVIRIAENSARVKLTLTPGRARLSVREHVVQVRSILLIVVIACVMATLYFGNWVWLIGALPGLRALFPDRTERWTTYLPGTEFSADGALLKRTHEKRQSIVRTGLTPESNAALARILNE